MGDIITPLWMRKFLAVALAIAALCCMVVNGVFSYRYFVEAFAGADANLLAIPTTLMLQLMESALVQILIDARAMGFIINAGIGKDISAKTALFVSRAILVAILVVVVHLDWVSTIDSIALVGLARIIVGGFVVIGPDVGLAFSRSLFETCKLSRSPKTAATPHSARVDDYFSSPNSPKV